MDQNEEDPRASYATMLHECERVLQAATERLQAGIGGPLHWRIALAAWLRCVSACRATVVLVEHHLAGEAAGTLRMAYEYLFYALALLKEPGVLDRLRAQDAHERRMIAQNALKDLTVQAVVDAEQRGALEALRDTPGDRQRISAYEAAEIAGLAAVYQTAYRQLSHRGTHANYSTIGESFGDSLDELRLVQDTEHLPTVLGLTRDCLTLGLGPFVAAQAVNFAGGASRHGAPA